MGRVVGARYRLLYQLGKGGMGSVWVGDHLELGSKVAIKFIDRNLAQIDTVRRRFKREARAAAALRGPNVVQVFDYGIDEGDPYLVMELLDGETLHSRLNRGRLTFEETRQVVGEVAKALARAHDLDIVHRDLKPANVFLVEDETGFVVKLLDFGVAKILHRGAPPSDQLTEPGSPIGTLHYMSPEQLRGAEVDARTDIWALAILTFECLTGVTPFSSVAPPNLISAICSAPIARVSSIAEAPPSLGEWFDRCICRDVELREPSVREMARHFMRITEDQTGLLPLIHDSERLSVPSVIAYTSTEGSFEEPRVTSSIPAAINDRRDIEHVALISRVNRESAVLWTRRRCVKGQLMKLTLHVNAEDDGYSTLARVVGVKKHPEGAPSMWHYGVNVRFEQPLEGLDAELEALGLAPSQPPPRP